MEIEQAFVELMKVLRSVQSQDDRLKLVNWAFEALDNRPGPLHGTGGKTPLPGAVFGVRCGKILVQQRFTSEADATKWALANYKRNPDAFTVEQIAP